MLSTSNSTNESSQIPDYWDDLRRKVYRRDDYTCQRCGVTDTEVHAHHIRPVSENGAHKKNNLITLCSECHEEEHGELTNWSVVVSKINNGADPGTAYRRANDLPDVYDYVKLGCIHKKEGNETACGLTLHDRDYEPVSNPDQNEIHQVCLE